MKRKYIQINDRFERLVVLEKLDERYADGSILYLCTCDCGKIIKVPTFNLRTGNTRSCGCLLKDIMDNNDFNRNEDPQQASWKVLYKSYRNDSRQLKFDLTYEYFKELCGLPCYYCDAPPVRYSCYVRRIDQVIRETSGGKPYKYNTVNQSFIYKHGVDRVDNAIGYIKENCVSCCDTCNKLKMAVTVKICEKVICFIKKKELKYE